jgi:hypothetical protein
MADRTFYATKTFRWFGKNIGIGGAVAMNRLEALWMLARGAVTEIKPKAKSKKK